METKLIGNLVLRDNSMKFSVMEVEGEHNLEYVKIGYFGSVRNKMTFFSSREGEISVRKGLSCSVTYENGGNLLKIVLPTGVDFMRFGGQVNVDSLELWIGKDFFGKFNLEKFNKCPNIVIDTVSNKTLGVSL